MTLRRYIPAYLLCLGALASMGCEPGSEPIEALCGPFEFDPATQTAPDEDDFPKVSSVLERRCGTLDCHGTLARPLRIYGAGGLRLFTLDEFNDSSIAQENGTVSGGNGTTAAEHEANRRSICGVEPELTGQVIKGELPPEELMVMKKPLEVERHKGGTVFQTGGPGAVCLSCWLRGFPDDIDCQDVVTECQKAIRDNL